MEDQIQFTVSGKTNDWDVTSTSPDGTVAVYNELMDYALFGLIAELMAGATPSIEADLIEGPEEEGEGEDETEPAPEPESPDAPAMTVALNLTIRCAKPAH